MRPTLKLKKPVMAGGFKTGVIPSPATKPITPPKLGAKPNVRQAPIGHPQTSAQFHALGAPKGRY